MIFNIIIVTSIALKISQDLPCLKLQISDQVPSLANGHQLRNISGLRSALPLSFLSHIKLPFSWSISCLYLLLSCVALSLLLPIHWQLKLGPSFWVWPVLNCASGNSPLGSTHFIQLISSDVTYVLLRNQCSLTTPAYLVSWAGERQCSTVILVGWNWILTGPSNCIFSDF